ncbi:MAG: helix-turn-helix transcriptional regulator [Clostridiales bacterium]|nr:helix-turn-helix transcriptional regulator [Clostridiales bacterium]
MFSDNIIQLRKLHNMTQEDLADKIGVTRQSVAQWESGRTCPNLNQSKAIADALGVSLDDLANYDPNENLGLNVPPRGKHLFGLVTVGDKGQIVIPARARKVFDIKPGDRLVVLGEEGQGIAIVKADSFLKIAEAIRNS